MFPVLLFLSRLGSGSLPFGIPGPLSVLHMLCRGRGSVFRSSPFEPLSLLRLCRSLRRRLCRSLRRRMCRWLHCRLHRRRRRSLHSWRRLLLPGKIRPLRRGRHCRPRLFRWNGPGGAVLKSSVRRTGRDAVHHSGAPVLPEISSVLLFSVRHFLIVHPVFRGRFPARPVKLPLLLSFRRP